MGLTRQQKKDALKHILENVFDLDPNSPIEQALNFNDIRSPYDLISLSEVEYELMEYKKEGARMTISKGNIGLLKSFKQYVHFKDVKGETINDTDWTSITCDEFDQFCILPQLDHTKLSPPPPTTQSGSSSLVQDF